MNTLDIPNIRELEDLLIEGVYSGIVKGRLDQRSSKFYISSSAGRDASLADVSSMLMKLKKWSTICSDVIRGIGSSAEKASNAFVAEQTRSDSFSIAIEQLKKEKKAASDRQAVSNGDLRNTAEDRVLQEALRRSQRDQ